jgi:uncharacterized delta-60 repeat protein
VAAGSTGLLALPFNFALARFLPDGTPDQGFGARGQVTTAFRSGQSSASAVAIERNGRIIAAGTSWSSDFSSSDFALARYLRNGRLDPGFGRSGRVVTDFQARRSP